MSKDNPIILYVGMDNKLYQTHPENGALFWNIREDDLIKLLEYRYGAMRLYAKLTHVYINPFKVIVRYPYKQALDFELGFKEVQAISYVEDWSDKLPILIWGM